MDCFYDHMQEKKKIDGKKRAKKSKEKTGQFSMSGVRMKIKRVVNKVIGF